MLSPNGSEVRKLALTPVAPEDRVATLDILRGFAMFGVLWMNLHGWYGALSVTPLDQRIAWIADWMMDSRFYSLLGFLFGIGFAIQLQRAEARTSDGPSLKSKSITSRISSFGGFAVWRRRVVLQNS